MVSTIREGIGPYSLLALLFNQTNVLDAAGDAEAWEASNTQTPPMLWAGSVVGLSVYHNADLTGGVITWTPSINAVADTDLAVVTDDTNQQAYGDIAPGKIPFVAGDRVGVSYTKTGTVAPTTTDVVILLIVLVNTAAD